MVENYQVVSSVRGPRKANFSLGLYITIVESRILRNEKYGSFHAHCTVGSSLPIPGDRLPCPHSTLAVSCCQIWPGRNQPWQRHTHMASKQWRADTATVGGHAQRHSTLWLRGGRLFFFFLTFRWIFWTTFIYLINSSRAVPLLILLKKEPVTSAGRPR